MALRPLCDMNDLKIAFRQLLKNPGFTAVAVLTLALGIGATTAIVSVVQTAVFDPLPVEHPERFVQLGVIRKELGWSPGINRLALRDLRLQTVHAVQGFIKLRLGQIDRCLVHGNVYPARLIG